MQDQALVAPEGSPPFDATESKGHSEHEGDDIEEHHREHRQIIHSALAPITINSARAHSSTRAITGLPHNVLHVFAISRAPTTWITMLIRHCLLAGPCFLI